MSGNFLNVGVNPASLTRAIGATAIGMATTFLAPDASADGNLKTHTAKCDLVTDWQVNLGDMSRFEDVTQLYRGFYALTHPGDDVSKVDPRDLYDLSHGVPLINLKECYGKFLGANEALQGQATQLYDLAVQLNKDGNLGLSHEEAAGQSPTTQAQIAALFGTYKLASGEELPEEDVVLKAVPPKAVYEADWQPKDVETAAIGCQGELNSCSADKLGLRGEVGLGAFASLLLLLGGLPLAFLYGRQTAARKDWSFRSRLGINLAKVRSEEKAQAKFDAAQKKFPDIQKKGIGDAKLLAGGSDVAKLAALAIVAGTVTTAVVDIGTVAAGGKSLMRTLEPLVPGDR